MNRLVTSLVFVCTVVGAGFSTGHGDLNKPVCISSGIVVEAAAPSLRSVSTLPARTVTGTKVTETIRQIWDGTEWVNESKQVFEYDSLKNKVRQSDLLWNGSEWVPEKATLFVYDEFNTLTSQFVYNTAVDPIQLESKNIYEWSSGHIVADTQFLADGAGGWIANTLETSQYNANDLIYSESSQWVDTAWFPTDRTTRVWTNGGLTHDILMESYDRFIGVWDSVKRYAYNYSSVTNLLDSALIQNFTSGAWEDFRLLVYTIKTVDANTHLFERALEYVPSSSGWDLAFDVAWSYSAANDQTAWTVQRMTGGVLTNDIRDTSTFVEDSLIPVVGTKRQGSVSARSHRGFSSLTLSPDGRRVTISFHCDAPGAVRLDAYNVAGKRVATLARGSAQSGKSTVTWDFSGPGGKTVEPGLYIILVRDGTHQEAHRVFRTK